MHISQLPKIILVRSLISLFLVAGCNFAHAFDWEKDGYTWKTGDYNGDNIEDLFLVQDTLMVPVLMNFTIILPVEQEQYVYLGSNSEVSRFSRQTVTLNDLANLSLTDLTSHRITFEDIDFDGQTDVRITSDTGANTLVFYGGDTETPEISYQYDAGEDQAVGFFSGTAQVTELGTASYSIPIDVPDYGMGIEPKWH